MIAGFVRWVAADPWPRIVPALLLARLVWVVAATVLPGGGYLARVRSITDGDTLRVGWVGRGRPIRVRNIDAPERATRGGPRGTRVMARTARVGWPVFVAPKLVGRRGWWPRRRVRSHERVVARVWVFGVLPLGLLLIVQGGAAWWPYDKKTRSPLRGRVLGRIYRAR